MATVAAVTSAVAAVVAFAPASKADDSDFTYGSGFAAASLLTPALNAGELSVPVILGEAAAGFQDETGRATSTMAAVPLLGASTGGGTTCGVKGGGTNLPLPPPLSADTSSTNNRSDVSHSKDTGHGLVVQDVLAQPRSNGKSHTQIDSFELPGLVKIGGATAVAQTTAASSKDHRESTATTSVAAVDLVGGLVHLKGMHWTLDQVVDGADSRTSQAKNTWSFSLDGITVNPPGAAPAVKIPIASPAGTTAAIATANALLERFGLTIVPPVFTDNGKGRLTVSPLQVHVGGPKWILAPVFGTVLSQQEAVTLQKQLLAFLVDPTNCEELLGLLKPFPPINAKYTSLAATAPLLAAAAVGVLSGGSASLSIGGVQAAIDDTYYAPLNFGGPNFFTPGGTNEPPSVVAGSTQLPPVHFATQPTAEHASTKCSSLSPAGAGCWRGLAPLAAGIAAGVAVATLAADHVSTRRRAARLARNEIA
ncbi:MAG TPA: hypothetical protein VHD87_17925 [Acidimicrobiales bacterium]|nr:hypothetical protein [Acidimicrobiales bacterium]